MSSPITSSSINEIRQSMEELDPFIHSQNQAALYGEEDELTKIENLREFPLEKIRDVNEQAILFFKDNFLEGPYENKEKAEYLFKVLEYLNDFIKISANTVTIYTFLDKIDFDSQIVYEVLIMAISKKNSIIIDLLVRKFVAIGWNTNDLEPITTLIKETFTETPENPHIRVLLERIIPKHDFVQLVTKQETIPAGSFVSRAQEIDGIRQGMFQEMMQNIIRDRIMKQTQEILEAAKKKKFPAGSFVSPSQKAAKTKQEITRMKQGVLAARVMKQKLEILDAARPEQENHEDEEINVLD